MHLQTPYTSFWVSELSQIIDQHFIRSIDWIAAFSIKYFSDEIIDFDSNDDSIPFYFTATDFETQT